MTLNEGSSFVVSSTLSLLLFSGMQVYKVALASSQLMTIATGFLGAILYVLLLTAVANLEKTVFGFNFQSKLGEVSSNPSPPPLSIISRLLNLISGCVLFAGRHVRCRVCAPGLRHHLPALLAGDDLEPEQDQPGDIRGVPASPRPNPAQEEEVKRNLYFLYLWHLPFYDDL